MKYPAYPEHKNSCVPWLGQIPAHWVVKRLIYIVILKSGEGITLQQIAITRSCCRKNSPLRSKFAAERGVIF